ncbi:MAG: hypothetical protein ACK4HQ_01205 [Brevinematales bacterium]
MKEHKPIPVTALILFFLVLCAGTFLVLSYWQTNLKQNIIDLQKAIQSLTNEFPLAEISLSQTSPEIVGQVIFYAPSGIPLQSEAFEMGGTDLYLEFLLISWTYETNHFVFGYPVRLYSDQVAPSEGIEIFDTFTNALSTEKDTERLAFLLTFHPPEKISISQKQTIAVHQYPGRVWQSTRYLVLYRQNGTIELREK